MRHNIENNSDYVHYSVFHKEVLDSFAEVKDLGKKIFVDCTLGEGGHTEMILENFPDVSIIAFERDPEILAVAKKRLERFGARAQLINDNFSSIKTYLSGMENSISAILYDFGISSYHFDVSARGFSYKDDEELDMRLDPGCEKSAKDIVNTYNEKDLANVIYQYGEERFSRRIARLICEAREDKEIRTSAELAEIVSRAIPAKVKRKQNIHPATRTFQAIRIEVNNELKAIEQTLRDAWPFLVEKGRIMAISFHSLEDRITKRTFKSLSKGCDCVDETYCQCDRISRVKILTRKPILPSEKELDENPRSRSAKLRICERV